MSMQAQIPLLEISGLGTSYGPVQALRGVDLTVNQGEIVALVGSNGAGKTTLLRTISGLQPALTGKIIYKGQDITRRPAHSRVNLGIAQSPEGRQVFGPMSVEDNLVLGGYSRKRDRAFNDDIDRMFGMFPILKEKQKQAAGMLSGGQQQMLAIARALMSRPTLLLLDEPSMGLAPLIVQEIFDTVCKLRDDGITILLVEQNATAALAIADQGFVLSTGEVVLSGKGKALLADDKVKHAYLGG